MKARTLQAFTMNNEEGPVTFRADRLVGQPRDGLLRPRSGSLPARLCFVSPVLQGASSRPCFARRAFARRFALGARASGSVLLPGLHTNTPAALLRRALLCAPLLPLLCDKAAAQSKKPCAFAQGLQCFGAQERTRTSTVLPAST